ncbi:hypothetical protein ACMYSK_10155 [Klebsiella sp. I138]|uniref:hypothetical protein n=1 Tax=Klebsiella sp. I138 TaxID=2755385 RepID=UPI003DAA2957
MRIFKKVRVTIYTLLFFAILCYSGMQRDDEPVDCTSAFSVISGEKTLSLSVTFSAYNGNGLITFTGGLDGIGDDLSIRKYFSYEKKRNQIYVFKNSDSEIRLPSLPNNESFGTFLPDFFTNPNKGSEFIVKIVPIKKGVWLFMSTNTPYFICENRTPEKG